MNDKANIGVFLCQCGEHIEPLIDLNALEKEIQQQDHVGHCETYPFPCLKPGRIK